MINYFPSFSIKTFFVYLKLNNLYEGCEIKYYLFCLRTKFDQYQFFDLLIFLHHELCQLVILYSHPLMYQLLPHLQLLHKQNIKIAR